MTRALALLAAVVLIPACRSIHSRRTVEKVARIEAGKTTKKDVLDHLGLPNDIERSKLADGRPAESWIYYKGADQNFILIHQGQGSMQIGTHRGLDRKDHAATIVFAGDVVLEVRSPFLKEPPP